MGNEARGFIEIYERDENTGSTNKYTVLLNILIHLLLILAQKVKSS